ncbi:ASCH domain-containing protein [Streptomyces canus]|uniref:ASCH domain-containing protein n=1 Tax=Streptomyces canus TaxID=58343 RepID=UPI002251096A|nr:ASCH domain-containing protein [Streptomyces canus]MCX4853899.1 ASCH domain-containing protein [Streptomyces canus]WSW40632.1 ASCH domain-containing protein [Streptomyces canus]
MTPLKRALLLSVHPQYAEAILLGTKTVEIRRRRVAVEPGTPLILYGTSSAKALLGAARIATVEVGGPDEVWELHHDHVGVGRAVFDRYVRGASEVTALGVEEPTPFAEPIPLARIRRVMEFRPPQSYQYVSDSFVRELVFRHPVAEQLMKLMTEPR